MQPRMQIAAWEAALDELGPLAPEHHLLGLLARAPESARSLTRLRDLLRSGADVVIDQVQEDDA